MIRHLDLFAGIGGFSLAASWTGKVEHVGFCEIDPWCQRVLSKHWPEVPQHDDIRTLTGAALERFGPVDLITGGYPCQPFSAAGLRRGKDDDRYLWPAMAAVIAEARPAYVLVENSPNIRTMVLDDMFDDLERVGYAVRAVIVPAAGVGALHRRDRMWTLAHLDGVRKPQSSGQQSEQQLGTGIAPAVAPDADRSGRRSGERHLQAGQSRASDGPLSAAAPATVPNADSERYLAPYPTLCPGRIPALNDPQWPTQPFFLRRIHGLPRRVDRVRGLGNAIVPQVAFELLNVMLGGDA